MIERAHLQEIINRVNEPRRLIQVITGPRQVGKTTVLTQLTGKLKKGWQFVSADNVAASNSTWLIQQWEAARIKMDQSGASEFVLIVDEVQKIRNWSEAVKLCWDTDTRDKRNLKVVLSGSSRLLLQMGLTESLAGRFETTYMGHWTYTEMHQAFGWSEEQYVWFGGYPGSAPLIDDEDRWKKYVKEALIETSISMDILMLTRVDKPALMKQLFELGCLYSGQVLSYTKMLGQLGDAGNTTTLAHYLGLLSSAGLLAGLEKYSAAALRKKSSSPKFQVFNTALISAQRTETFSEIVKNPVEWGRMVECAVGAHLLNSAVSGPFGIFYWREGNNEVDFVLNHKKLTGIEVMSGSSHSTKGMTAFQQKFSPDKLLLVGGNALGWKEVLRMDPVGLVS